MEQETQNKIVEPESFADFPIIDSYSRAEAIADGVLIDVSGTATECGFNMPVALTQAVWAGYVVPDERSRKFGQTERGRLWDTLSMLRLRILLHKKDDSILYFRVMYVLKIKQRRVIVLKSHCGPGDNAYRRAQFPGIKVHEYPERKEG